MNIELEYYPKIEKKILERSLIKIDENKTKWQEPFFQDTQSYLDVSSIKEIGDRLSHPNLKNVIVLGTGGSIQTLLSLKHLSNKTIYPITSSRAIELNECLNKTDPNDSIVIPISRSGETLDVNSSIGTFLERNYKFLGLSSRGTMNELLKEIDAPIMEVPDLSGRFAASITNVAIVPAYLSGVDIDMFLNGLKEGYREFMREEINPALEFATYLYQLYTKGYKFLFSMPYSKNLEGSIGLLVQEISESTGKDGKGLMGSYQEAPLCQHSVLEYLLGGTKGAVIPLLFIINKEYPDLILNSSIDYVNGKSAQTVINYQADATFQALLEQKVPSAKISIKNPNEKNIGNLISFIQSSVYYLCLLLDVNWANNPKVNIGKKICNEALKNNLPESKRKKNREEIVEKSFENFW
ncbi:MAG: hypothetical protein GF317_08130 [Candidatus Lokiarchaeota archaeon]|nr:hypothetical protein [Candidatus Lokiarchaeota archaeon]MBD3199678.1 hypothetical protein [Candidatus Lokiarchaeota archaeon]